MHDSFEHSFLAELPHNNFFLHIIFSPGWLRFYVFVENLGRRVP